MHALTLITSGASCIQITCSFFICREFEVSRADLGGLSDYDPFSIRSKAPQHALTITDGKIAAF